MGWISMQSSQSDLWDYVNPFEIYQYVRQIYSELHGSSNVNEGKIEQIAAAFGQGRMYFASAEPAPLGGSAPVLPATGPLQEAIDTTTPAGKLTFHIFAALAR